MLPSAAQYTCAASSVQQVVIPAAQMLGSEMFMSLLHDTWLEDLSATQRPEMIKGLTLPNWA